jgi:hypothetical protein
MIDGATELARRQLDQANDQVRAVFLRDLARSALRKQPLRRQRLDITRIDRHVNPPRHASVLLRVMQVGEAHRCRH